MANPFIDKLRTYTPLSSESVDALAAATAHPRKYPRHFDLIREGDKPGPVFVVLAGWACRYKILPTGTRQIMAFLMPGDSCDLHVNVLTQMDHSIQTMSAATVATVARDVMDSLTDRHDVARALYTSQLVDEGTMRAWIVSMGRRNALERVAHLMCELYLRGRAVGLTDGPTLTLPLSQTGLADALGLTPVHVNRVLKTLRLAGAMKLQRGSLTIADPARLAGIAGFDENYLHRRMGKPLSAPDAKSGSGRDHKSLSF